ncbi:hypothetical protein BDZ85DRAFT_129198 [Elsinoe ampelina]|uniref:CENP-V/GFA domain-containing protein n=1 Tax=Elsinoe ampelina TaxID=302913 RepID=A0A6A6GAB6_9PEZI|nr:hypothetical protein BDZ85DRAFT_129198 [Elsinoe ampelina]
MTQPSHPITITGGCNCLALRYSITLPPTTTLPLSDNGVCLCTLCRKFTGAVIPRLLSCHISWSNLPLFHHSAEYKTYTTTVVPGVTGHRGFCSTCGSSLSFHGKAVGEMEWFEIFLGTVDEDVLAGKKVGETEGRFGKRAVREGGWGDVLLDTSMSGHIWVENATQGYDLVGPKRWRMEQGKEYEVGTMEEGREE